MAAEPKRPSEANDRLKTQIATSFLSGLVQLSAPAVVSLLSSPPQSQKTPPEVRAPTSLLFPATPSDSLAHTQPCSHLSQMPRVGSPIPEFSLIRQLERSEDLR